MPPTLFMFCAQKIGANFINASIKSGESKRAYMKPEWRLEVRKI